MIRPDRLTLKASEALQQAAALAAQRGNPVVNDAHLFLALLDQEEGIVVPLLQKAGLSVTELRSAVERDLSRLPTQSEGGAQPTMSRELTKALDQADKLAKELRDMEQKLAGAGFTAPDVERLIRASGLSEGIAELNQQLEALRQLDELMEERKGNG